MAHADFSKIFVDRPILAAVLSLLVLWIQRSELPVLIGDELMMALHGEAVMH